MSSSREQILQSLRRETLPFPTAEAPSTYQHMVPLNDLPPGELETIFIENAQKAACLIHQPASQEEAINTLLEIIGDDKKISCWEPDQIPLDGLEMALEQAGIAHAGEDASVQVGVTGVDAALAATGSLVLRSGNGRYRAASLLPPTHVAVVARSQITTDLETWLAEQRAKGLASMREASNIVIITGPSRTADIAMQLVMGMHGPGELHIILNADSA
jgi:L-lactate dehydrogenase complex protein LldG